jgi:hypothetical protein
MIYFFVDCLSLKLCTVLSSYTIFYTTREAMKKLGRAMVISHSHELALPHKRYMSADIVCNYIPKLKAPWSPFVLTLCYMYMNSLSDLGGMHHQSHMRYIVSVARIGFNS